MRDSGLPNCVHIGDDIEDSHNYSSWVASLSVVRYQMVEANETPGSPSGQFMRGPGVEPGSLRWQRKILPINQPRLGLIILRDI